MTKQLALRIRSAVGERALRELPDAFVGVEFRGITGEAVEVKSEVPGLERANRFAAVDRAVVPDHDHGATEVAEQVPEERAHFGMLDVLGRQ